MRLPDANRGFESANKSARLEQGKWVVLRFISNNGNNHERMTCHRPNVRSYPLDPLVLLRPITRILHL